MTTSERPDSPMLKLERLGTRLNAARRGEETLSAQELSELQGDYERHWLAIQAYTVDINTQEDRVRAAPAYCAGKQLEYSQAEAGLNREELVLRSLRPNLSALGPSDNARQ